MDRSRARIYDATFSDYVKTTLLSFLGSKFAISVAFNAMYVFTAEMFPTDLRMSLIGITSMFGRLGSMIAPQMTLLVTTRTRRVGRPIRNAQLCFRSPRISGRPCRFCCSGSCRLWPARWLCCFRRREIRSCRTRSRRPDSTDKSRNGRRFTRHCAATNARAQLQQTRVSSALWGGGVLYTCTTVLFF